MRKHSHCNLLLFNAAVLVQRLYVCRLVPKCCCGYHAAPAGCCKPGHNRHSPEVLLKVLYFCFCCTTTAYRSSLNDFQRSEGRELVPTSWNSARVWMLPGLHLEDCATRCSSSLDCRYPPSLASQGNLFPI